MACTGLAISTLVKYKGKQICKIKLVPFTSKHFLDPYRFIRIRESGFPDFLKIREGAPIRVGHTKKIIKKELNFIYDFGK